MTVTYVDQASGTSSTANISLTIPATVQAGDLMIAAAQNFNCGHYTPSVPTGWTQADHTFNIVGSSTHFGVIWVVSQTIFKRVATAGDAGSTLTFTTAATGSIQLAAVAAWRGTDGVVHNDLYDQPGSTLSSYTPPASGSAPAAGTLVAVVFGQASATDAVTVSGGTARSNVAIFDGSTALTLTIADIAYTGTPTAPTFAATAATGFDALTSELVPGATTRWTVGAVGS